MNKPPYTDVALDAIACAVIVVDAAGTIVFANETTHRMFGYSTKSLVGAPIELLVPTAGRVAHANLRAQYQQLPSKRSMGSRQELLGRRQDDSTFPVQVDLCPLVTADGTQVVATVLDATLVREAAERDSHMAAIVNSSDDAVIGEDLHGNIQSWNPGAERIFGYSATEVVGRHISVLMPRDRSTEEAEFLRHVAAGETLSHIEARRVCKDGSLVDISVTLSPIRSASGQVLGAAKIARNVTAEHRQELERIQRLEELELANKELDDFVYVASHDLRSPLRAVKSLATWIQTDDAGLGAQTRERLMFIQGRIDRMMRLLDDVLSYARARSIADTRGECLAVPLLVAEIATSLRTSDRFRILSEPGAAAVEILRTPLEQVLLNLISNSIKHHDCDRGTVTVAVADQGERWRFSVIDDGPGIPEAYRESVFDMFSVLKPRDEVEGSGLGLSIVRKIVQRLGGRCGVEPAEPRGTVIWFDWPKNTATREEQS